MQAVGRLGGYISRSVYTVSGPFHPFGGAVDIIVVQQPDGSYKSSPWYVRFGKFQGVLKRKEKVVSISVNDVEADFHMYLDNKGEAFFLKELDTEEEGDSVCSPPSSSGEDSDRQAGDSRRQVRLNSCNYDSNWSDSTGNEKKVITKTNSRRSQILGLVFGRRSRKEEGNQEGDNNNASDVVRTDSLERAEIAADLLELKWSTNLALSTFKKDKASRFSSVDVSKDEHLDVNGCSYDEPSSISCTVDEDGVERLTSEYVVETTTSVESVGEGTNLSICVVKSTLNVDSQSVATGEDEVNKQGSTEGPAFDPQISSSVFVQESRISEEEQLLFGNLDDFHSADAQHEVNDPSDVKLCTGVLLDQSVINDYMNNANVQKRRLRSVSSDACINKNGEKKELTRMVRSLPTLSTLSDNLEANNNHQSCGAQTMAGDVKILKESEEGPAESTIGNPPRSIDSLRGSRRGWPFSFKRSRSVQISHLDTNSCENLKANKKVLRTLTPTSEQLASLNLKEGKNTIVFTFSTAMLGKQQVDARIFLWRWDTRIVISDVDGTITRSDLLGQVMPLVGMDWSQTGVAHLFSAIKENGYQLLFLSARSISQSFHTRQFLFNIKQDGKALPEGPVVISPDGLFPSLFREVVRRAPHEFKIACLEDIKALFPADTNPFYAGFGNRDTDEFSYLKVGIPRGKIFIINTKGEVAVNRRVDTKSYHSLHTLVHGMFPTMSCSEQEDFNSWNYWKLPPPTTDL